MPTPAEIFQLAVQHHQAGNLPQAEQLYQQVLQQEPRHVDALHMLGLLAHGVGRPDVACDYISRAVRVRPDFAEARCNLGTVLQQLGRLDEAVASWREALRLKPQFAEAHSNLGMALMERGRLAEAAASLRQAVEIKPHYAEAHNNLGNVLQQQKKFVEALACYQQALLLKPDYADALMNIGTTLQEQGKFAEAVVYGEQALRLRPDYSQARFNLGLALLGQQRSVEAIAQLQRAIELQPNHPQACFGLGLAYQEGGRLDEAETWYRRALQLKGDYAEAHHNLGFLLVLQGRPVAALASLREALRLRPDFAEAHNNVGLASKDQGHIDEALAAFRKAVRAKPDHSGAFSNLLLTSHYRTGVTLAELARLHQTFEQQFAAPLRSAWRRHGVDRDPGRKLRVGLVSADFRFHPIGQFLIRAVENLPRDAIELSCYSNWPHADELTRRFQAAAATWWDVVKLSDAELAERVRGDEIDILVDLAGHTAANRLLAFARKPAPIQITWIGYEGTTGLAAMDYIIGDRFTIPAASEASYSERVLRMPDCYICFEPPAAAPDVEPPPALRTGQVTFGSFNNPAKVTAQVMNVWADILRRTPGSRLLLKYRGWDETALCERMWAKFAERGIARERLELQGWSPYGEMLAAYQDVDIALDPFPFAGGVTTCTALWMGVPVVTAPGDIFASRHSYSYLSNVGLTETIAENLQGYIRTAVDLARDLPQLAELRSGLRRRMAASPLCDGPRFGQNLAALLRDVWVRYCQSP